MNANLITAILIRVPAAKLIKRTSSRILFSIRCAKPERSNINNFHKMIESNEWILSFLVDNE